MWGRRTNRLQSLRYQYLLFPVGLEPNPATSGYIEQFTSQSQGRTEPYNTHSPTHSWEAFFSQHVFRLWEAASVKSPLMHNGTCKLHTQRNQQGFEPGSPCCEKRVLTTTLSSWGLFWYFFSLIVVVSFCQISLNDHKNVFDQSF